MSKQGIYVTETERPAVTDKEGEYSYLFTECGNRWYSTTTNPMYRDGCICPKCGKVIKVIMPKGDD